MANNYWNNWYFGWGWLLWVGFIFLIFSTTGNWGYTYSAHRRFRGLTPDGDALDALSSRYAKGEIQRDEFHKIRDEINNARRDSLAIKV
jgi:putative membrane protein